MYDQLNRQFIGSESKDEEWFKLIEKEKNLTKKRDEKVEFCIYMNKISNNSWEWLKDANNEQLESEYEEWTEEMRPCS
mgnify:CR=1|tara:strand:- start:1096 stop:1329 length:234 start_codon:yes stop_codon:yes gene_type:complete